MGCKGVREGPETELPEDSLSTSNCSNAFKVFVSTRLKPQLCIVLGSVPCYRAEISPLRLSFVLSKKEEGKEGKMFHYTLSLGVMQSYLHVHCAPAS